jgi:hypothetical protein
MPARPEASRGPGTPCSHSCCYRTSSSIPGSEGLRFSGRCRLGLKRVGGRHSHPPSRLLPCLGAEQLQQPRRRAVDQRPTCRMIVPLGAEQPSGEQQGQRLRAVMGRGDRPLRPDRPDRELRRAPELLDPAPAGHAVHDHDGQHLGLFLGQPRQLFGLDQLGHGVVEAPIRRQLHMAAVFALAASKARVGAALGNPVLQTESRVTLIDGFLAMAVLVGLLLNALLGWWGQIPPPATCSPTTRLAKPEPSSPITRLAHLSLLLGSYPYRPHSGGCRAASRQRSASHSGWPRASPRGVRPERHPEAGSPTSSPMTLRRASMRAGPPGRVERRRRLGRVGYSPRRRECGLGPAGNRGCR